MWVNLETRIEDVIVRAMCVWSSPVWLSFVYTCETPNDFLDVGLMLLSKQQDARQQL